jgi:hypothetical protein
MPFRVPMFIAPMFILAEDVVCVTNKQSLRRKMIADVNGVGLSQKIVQIFTSDTHAD